LRETEKLRNAECGEETKNKEATKSQKEELKAADAAMFDAGHFFSNLWYSS
jgi:hypothetical protein